MSFLTRCVAKTSLFVSVSSACNFERFFLSEVCNPRRPIRIYFCAGNIHFDCRRLGLKAFSTTGNTCVKFFEEKENDYAHAVMARNTSYSEKLYRKGVLECNSSCDEYVRFVNNDWSSASPSELLSAFKNTTSYCVAHSKAITEPELNNICTAVAKTCAAFSDEELIECLECLTHWPETESLNSVNFVDVWSALDKECVARTKTWDKRTLLYVADVWYALHFSRISKYMGECIWRLARKVKHMSPQELVQCLFYMNSSRNFKVPGSMYEFEFYVEQCVQNLSIDELAIVAMGFFKSKTKICSPRLMSFMIQKTAETIDSVNEISLCALMKLFRYCLSWPLAEDVHKLLDKVVPNISCLSLFCCVQIALVGTPIQLFHEQIISAIVERFVKEMPSSRMKDIERIIFVLTLFDYLPKSAPDFYDNVVAELQNRASSTEVRQYPKNLAYCLNFLSINEIYPFELVDKVLSHQFIEETYDAKKTLYNLGRELLCLDVGVEIECPEYRGNRLDPKARHIMAKRYTKYIPDRTKKTLSASERLFIDVLVATEEAVGQENVHADIISPNYSLPDIVFGFDAEQKTIRVTGLFSKYSIEDVKYPPKTLGNQRWYCLVVGNINMFIKDTSMPLGTTKMRLRHFTKIGYHPILVPWFEFTKLTASERQDYLRKKIFSVVDR